VPSVLSAKNYLALVLLRRIDNFENLDKVDQAGEGVNFRRVLQKPENIVTY
jgi:hypothetical protein